MHVLISLLIAATSPVEGRFLLEVAGFPVAEIRVWADDTVYRYQSIHFLEEGPREHRVELKRPFSTPPEVFALLQKPSLGCTDVLEERRQVREKLCVDRIHGAEVNGSLGGESFAARYDAQSRLAHITVGAARWVSEPSATKSPIENPFKQGIAVPSGPLKLVPPFAGSRWLETAPQGTGKPEGAGRTRCLVLAREEVKKHPTARLSVGLVVDQGRAYPHAWVTEDGQARDPTVPPDDAGKRRYLEVPTERSGEFFLHFFDGSSRLEPR